MSGVPHCHGGFADVWKSDYRGREVAVKVLRIYANSDLQKITRVSPLTSNAIVDTPA